MSRRRSFIVASSRHPGDGSARHPQARTRAALALSIVTLASASPSPTACAADDWAAVVGGGADAQLTKRLEADVRTLPGTDTRYTIGGFLELDGIAARHKQTGNEQDTFLVSATPFGPASSEHRLSVRQSQINWLSYTPTEGGTITARVQANLFSLDLDGKTTVSLQQLYVRVADALVAGKTYSTFVDANALPTTLDYNGPSGQTSAEQWQVRASMALGPGWTVAAGLEDALDNRSANDASVELRTHARRPDLAARLTYDFGRGHLQLAGVSRRIAATATLGPSTFARTVEGSGISISGSLATIGDDSLVGQVVTGKGIGRYFNDSLSATGIALDAEDRLRLFRSTGATLYYQHRWAPDWMSVAGASTLWAASNTERLPDELRRLTYVSANLIHRLLPTLSVGAETLWGRATRVDGVTATNARLQVSLRYLVE